MWLTTIGESHFGPIVRLALSARIHVNVFVQVRTATDAKVAAVTGAQAIVLQGKDARGLVSSPEMEAAAKTETIAETFLHDDLGESY